MKKAGALASALRSSGATVASSSPPAMSATEGSVTPSKAASQPSRQGTKPITAHFPEEVRRQLKSMAGEQGRFIDDLMAEALNMLFAKYRKPEIAPRKVAK